MAMTKAKSSFFTSSAYAASVTEMNPIEAINTRSDPRRIMLHLHRCLFNHYEAELRQQPSLRCRNGEPHRECQPAGLVPVRETGLIWANMLRAFQVGKALTSDGEPSTWMRLSRMACTQVSWPA